MKFGVPSIGLVALDWWTVEFLALFAAGLSVRCIAIQVIVMNNGGIFYMPQGAFMVSAEILIGHCIGDGNIKLGKEFLRLH